MKRKTYRSLAALLALVLTVTLMAPTAFAASAYDRPGQKLLALTFDDGPSVNSDKVLDVLKKHNAKATFFIGGRITSMPEPVRRMVAEGHQIGNHTLEHPYLKECSDQEIQRQVNTMAQLMTEVTGLTGTGNTGFYLRPPYASYDQRVARVANVPLCWLTVDSLDWQYKSGPHLIDFVTKNARDGDVVLVHETVPSTVNALDQLLTALEKKGFELVTMEELFFRRGITPKAGGIYFDAKNTGVNRCDSSLWWDESKLNTHWAWNSINYVKQANLMTGNQYGEFTPQFPLTRGMFVTILGRLEGVAAGNVSTEFKDIPARHYSAPYVVWAKEKGIMVGMGDGTFGVDKTLTRQEMAVTLARYAAYRGERAPSADLSMYQDRNAVADWAKQGVAECSALGLLQGSDGLFRPNDSTTRAMGATILHRLCEYDFHA